jgi:predicted aldo/keto reductase-like oxidoreductase
MPCPRGVNIPGCFSAYNMLYTMGLIPGMSQYITSTALTSQKYGSPTLCVSCGKCEGHCPQKLPVMQNLRMVRRKMEPWILGAGCAVWRRISGSKQA